MRYRLCTTSQRLPWVLVTIIIVFCIINTRCSSTWLLHLIVDYNMASLLTAHATSTPWDAEYSSTTIRECGRVLPLLLPFVLACVPFELAGVIIEACAHSRGGSSSVNAISLCTPRRELVNPRSIYHIQFRRFSHDHSGNLIHMILDRFRRPLEFVHDDQDDFAPKLLA